MSDSSRSAPPSADTSKGASSTIIDKAFVILQAFSGDERVLTLGEITRATGLPKSTVHRVLARLVANEVVEPHGEGYKLGLMLVRFGSTSLAGLLRDIALPYMTELRRWSGQRVELTVLRRTHSMCLERIDSTPRCIHDVGVQTDAHLAAAGRVILAFAADGRIPADVLEAATAGSPEPAAAARRFAEGLATVRRHGIAEDDGDTLPGVRVMAAPIVPVKQANAAISLLHPSGTALPPTAARALADAASRISTDLRRELTGDRRGRWLPQAD